MSKVGRYIGMACLLFACMMVTSCRDEYFYDDTEPPFVGPSIYDYLVQEKEFTLFLRVIDDLKYGEVLDRTGSKTLFVANDDAFKKGIYEAWGIESYEELSTAHKRIILNSAMLDNAYLLEMLSKMQSTGTNVEPIPGQCLRRETSASIVDTIGLFYDKDLPQNNPYWDVFRTKGARLAIDATPSLMLHLIEDFLYQETVDETDLRVITGRPTASKSDMYIFDKKVIKERSDKTCRNGYVHQLDGLLIPPSNMAEELRKNGLDVAADLDANKGGIDLDASTYIFSRVLDRFAVPVPIEKTSQLAETYYLRYPERIGEQLYEKKYFAGKLTSYKDTLGVTHNAGGSLLFDPGWNAYEGSGTKKERDMAAIFAPSDRAFIHYFTQEETGMDLIKRFAYDVDDNTDITKGRDKGLFQAIDSIPLDVMEKLVNNHLQVSFVSSVPSKFHNVVNDARDSLGVKQSDLSKTILANNGIVYVTDKVYRPARFGSVIAPVMLSDSLYVFNQMIETEGYDSYLLSMQNKFGLIVSADTAVFYYEPKPEKEKKDRVIYQFVRNDVKNKETGVVESSVKVKEYTQVYDTKKKAYIGNMTAKSTDWANVGASYFYKEILEYNIVKGEMNSEKDCSEGKKYYETKGYGSVKVQRGADGTGPVTAIAGGRELQQGRMTPLAETFGKENGQTFQLKGSLIQPPTQSVRDVLTDSTVTGKCFNKFYQDLCVPDSGVLTYLYKTETWDKEKNPEVTEDVYLKRFRVFANGDDRIVEMFNTFNYTVYVPTAGALEEAYRQGLKTWSQLADSLKMIQDPNSGLTTTEKKASEERLRANAKLISKFVRYHFQDGAVFVDNSKHVVTTQGGKGTLIEDFTVEYTTSAMNDVTNRFSKVVVQTDEVNKTIAVRGDFGEDDDEPLSNCTNVCRVINTDPAEENKTFNVMTRDLDFANAASNSINTSSYAVVHLIDNFLVYGGDGGIYDAKNQKFITYTE